jgi:DNA polymerase-4
MILHIDMDAFYASVEELDNPWLKGKCVIVGGTSNRGVVSAASYTARKLGVHSAMPIFQAKQKCPEGIFIPPRMDRYKEISKKIMSLLGEFTPLVEVVSIDEAYLDISDTTLLHGGPEDIALQIKQRIKDAVNLTCSIGVAPIKFLAKIASDMNKPDGLTVILPDDVPGFIDTLPIQKVPGVGKKTFRQLELMGISKLGDINKYPEKTLLDRLGKFGNRLMELAAGNDHSQVTPYSQHKSVSSERTLAEDTRDKSLLKRYLLKQAEEVARHLRKSGCRGKTITIKLKHSDFKQITRSITIAAPTQSSKKIFQHAACLLDDYKTPKKLRLIGVGVSNLISTEMPVQMDLFERRSNRGGDWTQVDRTVEDITKKFGRDAIKRATFKEK